VIEDESLLAHATDAGTLLKEGIEAFMEKHPMIKEVRGKGLMLGVVLDQPAKPLADKLQEMGLLTIATAENVVRMLPPLNVKDSELEEALDIFEDALSELQGGEKPAGE
jgi:acetylornithine/N-succinyldiaminopimelate aminotransferase